MIENKSISILASSLSLIPSAGVSSTMEMAYARLLGYDGVEYFPKKPPYVARRVLGSISGHASFMSERSRKEARDNGLAAVVSFEVLLHESDWEQYNILKSISGGIMPIIAYSNQVSLAKFAGFKEVGVQVANDMTNHLPFRDAENVAAWCMKQGVYPVVDTYHTPKTGISVTDLVNQGLDIRESHVGIGRNDQGKNNFDVSMVKDNLQAMQRTLKRIVIETNFPWQMVGVAKKIRGLLS